MDPALQQVTAQTAAILIQNTASIVATKVQSAKAQKDSKQTIDQLSEIINDLVADNSQLQSAAQAYKQELVAQQITDEDIKFITETVLPLLESMSKFAEKPIPEDTMEAIKGLISPEMLNVLQLVGFNYKSAIGQPLTQLVRNMISNSSPAPQERNLQIQQSMLSYQIALVDLAKDPEAFERFMALSDSSNERRR